jgi:hypothetical protein
MQYTPTPYNLKKVDCPFFISVHLYNYIARIIMTRPTTIIITGQKVPQAIQVIQGKKVLPIKIKPAIIRIIPKIIFLFLSELPFDLSSGRFSSTFLFVLSVPFLIFPSISPLFSELSSVFQLGFWGIMIQPMI